LNDVAVAVAVVAVVVAAAAAAVDPSTPQPPSPNVVRPPEDHHMRDQTGGRALGVVRYRNTGC
jgi:hypothetical protein